MNDNACWEHLNFLVCPPSLAGSTDQVHGTRKAALMRHFAALNIGDPNVMPLVRRVCILPHHSSASDCEIMKVFGSQTLPPQSPNVTRMAIRRLKALSKKEIERNYDYT